VKDVRAVAAVPFGTSWAVCADYLALMKPRLNLLVVFSSAAGYYLGSGGSQDIALAPMLLAVTATALVAAGAAALNQAAEHGTDRLMDRTRHRPVPDGRISPADARLFGVGLVLSGLTLLAANAHLLAALLALATVLIYIAIYTPLKRRTPTATLVGAVPGALPPLIGWTAARGTISLGGMALFAIVFLWQIPHFMAIAWLYRDDYRKAGFPMLPVLDSTGRRAGRQAVIYSVLLLGASVGPALFGVSGSSYLAIALFTGIALLAVSVRFARARTHAAARWLFLGTIAYLPVLWIAMIADRL
jgi:heme o synthase